jgi:hypothetical protein
VSGLPSVADRQDLMLQPTINLTCTSLEGLTQPPVTGKLLNVQDSHRLKRPASAVQLRPWPLFYQWLCSIVPLHPCR